MQFHARILSAVILFNSCGNQSQTPSEEAVVLRTPAADTTYVPVTTVERLSFVKQTFSNGTLEAVQKVKVPFKTEGTISEITVSNGQHVKSGQLLARINDSWLQLELSLARTKYNRALLELEDLLLGLLFENNKQTDPT